jgi:membrane protease YdiL (CAAX protease family)
LTSFSELDPHDRRRTMVALVATIVWLAVWNIARSHVADELRPMGALVVAAGILVISRWGSLSAAELGLARRFLGRGLRLGLLAFAAIAAVILVAGLVPAVRDWFDDPRVDVGWGAFLFRVVVAIPFGTVVLEELAFRGSLLALLRRIMSTWSAVIASSVLFGLWHLPSLTDASAVEMVGTMIATTAAGIGFCWLRLRSGSLLAPVLAHLATNAVTFTVAWALATR